MSYSIRKILKENDIVISACWIDDCGKGEVIDGIPVMDIRDIQETYKQFNVVLGHSKYELADEIQIRYKAIKKVYCLVNVCYGQWKHISMDFVKIHIDDYLKSYNLLHDEKSKKCFIAYLNCKLSEDYHYLVDLCKKEVSYFRNPFFDISEKENYVDIGAYDGDTIRDFLDVAKTYETIYAIEPEDESFRKLERYVEGNSLENVELYKCGCWDDNTILKFSDDEESSSIGESGENQLQVYRLDDMLQGKEISIIKINFLNGVRETLKGAEKILKQQKPKLIITIGFDEWGLINIPPLINSINSEYKLSLRYASAMPARLILFAY